MKHFYSAGCIVVTVFTVASYGAVPSIEDACPLPDANGVSTFTIPAETSIGKINTMLIKFDTKRRLPIYSMALHDQLNTNKDFDRGSVGEPFGPVSETCPSLTVPTSQFNCTGGISMTDAQKAKATPKYTWDRGHLTPANPNRFSEDALNKTFYCVNLAPQDSWTNQEAWKNIELFTENKMAELNGYVMTGVCSADNLVDGPTTYRGYAIPQCFWKLACYKDKKTGAGRVVGYIGDNTIVNFNDKVAQAARTASTYTPRSQTEILALLAKPEMINQGWKDAETSLLPGRQVDPALMPKATQCIAGKTATLQTISEWQVKVV